MMEFKTALRQRGKKNLFSVSLGDVATRDGIFFSFHAAMWTPNFFGSIPLEYFFVAARFAALASRKIFKQKYKPFQWIPWLVGR